MNEKRIHDYFLFSRPSTISGIGSVLDIGGTLNDYNSSSSPEEADFNAIYDDWKAVGEDLKEAIRSVQK